jgi:poly(3-hydroxybutyrate) depolymerase
MCLLILIAITYGVYFKFIKSHKEIFSHDEDDRRFFVNTPKDFQDSTETFPAIIMIHGYRGSPAGTDFHTSMSNYGTKSGYIVASTESN